MEHIITRNAGMDEVERIMLFLKEHWGKDHILANNKDLMLYEHAWTGKFTYVLAEDEKTGQIYGICGYLPYSLEEKTDMGAGIWKAIPGSPFMLGSKILKYVQEHNGCEMLACCGTNVKTKGHRKLIGHFNGRLKHFYRLNSQVKNFKIAVINIRKEKTKINDLGYHFLDLKKEDDLKGVDILKWKRIKPYRDYVYLEHRYFHHPKYQYRILGIQAEKDIAGVLVGREIECNGNKIFRVIDYLGEESALAGTYDAWEELLIQGEYEYIDFYQFGLSDQVMADAGFVERKEYDVNIIPNYFEPFEQKNIDINISTNWKEPFRMFKGDADQDRPNQM